MHLKFLCPTLFACAEQGHRKQKLNFLWLIHLPMTHKQRIFKNQDVATLKVDSHSLWSQTAKECSHRLIFNCCYRPEQSTEAITDGAYVGLFVPMRFVCSGGVE